MIKAVIFDCFGVLAQDAWHSFREVYVKNNDTRSQADDALSQVASGLISYEDFYAQLAETLDVPGHEIRMKLTENPPNVKLFEFIEKILIPTYKIGMLSNAGADRTVELFGAERTGLFNDVLLSYQIGMTKPNPAIYELAAQRLGVLSEECIFVDDQLRYCDGAEQAGMKAVHFDDTDQTIAKIRELIDA